VSKTAELLGVKQLVHIFTTRLSTVHNIF